MMEARQQLIKAYLLKGLIDKNEQKRKIARTQLERIVFHLAERGEVERIQQIIQFFARKYIKATDFNRKAVGLEIMPTFISALQHNHRLLIALDMQIVGNILRCLNDSEAKIRCVAIKSLFEITRILKDRCVRLFNVIFERIIGCINDGEDIVRQACKFLNNTLSGILTNSHENRQDFNLAEFVSILKSKLKTLNLQVRIFLIGWIKNLMQLNLIMYLPDFLEDLLILYSEQELKKDVFECLATFEAELKQKFHDGSLERLVSRDYINQIVTILVRVAKNKYPSYTKLQTLQWLNIFFTFFKEQVEVKQPKLHQKLYFKKIIIERFDEVLEPILLLMSHQQEEVRRQSIYTNDILMASIKKIEREEPINFVKVIPILKEVLSQKKATDTSEYAINWMKFMLQSYNDKIIPQIKEIIEKLIEKIYESSVKNITDIIQNTKLKQEYFDLLIEKMLAYLFDKGKQSEDKIEFMMKKFVSLKDSRQFCVKLCNQLKKYTEEGIVDPKIRSKYSKFRYEIAANLNVILVNEQSMINVRKTLTQWSDSSYPELFIMLFNALKFNPPALISLCLLSQQYELANQIINTLIGKYEISSGVLIGLCKLVSLMEKPAFFYLRMQILERRDHFLLQSLNSLLMILPQGKIFNMLRNRLDSSGLISSKTKIRSLQVNSCRNPIDITKCYCLYLEVYGLNQ